MGWIDSPLTAEGKTNAKSSAAKLKDLPIDLIVSSDLGRAFITAYLIARQLGYDSEIEVFSDLREMNYGDLANQPYHNYPELSPEENTFFTPPNGESLDQMQKRVLECINKIGANNEGKTTLIVAHDGTINAIMAHYNKRSLGLEDDHHNAHDFVAKFEWDQGQIKSLVELPA